MATYSELFRLANENAVLRQRVVVACVVAAEAIRNEAGSVANHANRLVWAAKVFADPVSEAQRMLWAALAANAAATVAAIEQVTDAALQTIVNNAVNTFATTG